MATVATDIVSVAVMRQQLRIEPDDASHDDLIEAAIAGAVSHVEARAQLPLLDVTQTEPGVFCGRMETDPVRINLNHVVSITEVEYWERTQELREEPTGSIPVATLGRFATWPRKYAVVYPPPAGWPMRLEGSCIRFTVRRAFEITPSRRGLQSAVILAARQLFEGHREVPPTDAMHTFLAPWISY